MSDDDFGWDFKKSGKGFHLLLQQILPAYNPFDEGAMYWKPFIDMYEADDKLIVMVDISGVDSNDITLKIKGNFYDIGEVYSLPLSDFYNN